MKKYKSKNKQSGVALAIGIILLLIISTIGITSMKSALLQERMAAGLNNRELADAAALSLMVEVERWLFNYYNTGNGVALVLGGLYMVESSSSESNLFRTERALTSASGFAHVNGIDINALFDNKLDAEPRFIIEPIDDTAAGASGGTAYGETEAENDGGSAGGSGGSGSDTGEDGNEKLHLYRIVTKATDTTGHLFSAFESTMTIKPR